jgi:predicted RNA-binding protein YlqC (UPF0109 family)
MTKPLSTEMEEAVTAPDSAQDTPPDSKDAKVREMLYAVLQFLVDETDKLELIHVTVAEGVAFQVRCAAPDIGKIIGKKGRTARAIRIILAAISSRSGRRYSMDIAETTTS